MWLFFRAIFGSFYLIRLFFRTIIFWYFLPNNNINQYNAFNMERLKITQQITLKEYLRNIPGFRTQNSQESQGIHRPSSYLLNAVKLKT